MLCPQDALLGPWLPGRELLEDELRAFAGMCCVCEGWVGQRILCCAVIIKRVTTVTPELRFYPSRAA